MITFERLGPVLTPDREYIAKFNAGMVAVDGAVHMAYRLAEKGKKWHGRPIDWAQYEIDREFPYVKNCVCYARLGLDGRLIDDSGEEVISPSLDVDRLGCEDARIVPFDGLYYLFYCAYDGIAPRVGIAQTADFKRYVKLGVVPCPYPDKDAFIFPRRIGSKIAYVHRVPPTIQVDYFDSIEAILIPENWHGYQQRLERSTILAGVHAFEALKVGGGVPPIETEAGWLLLYHAVDQTGLYHTGAALLDLDNPGRILARLPYPLLSPSEPYEIDGDYRGCVFAMGHFLEHGNLYVSYGAADKCTAIAKVSLENLLSELRVHSVRI